jgi:hypothetical protein
MRRTPLSPDIERLYHTYHIKPPPLMRLRRLDGIGHRLDRLTHLARLEITGGRRSPWRRRWRAWRHGFTSGIWALYELDRHDPGLYLSEVTGLRTFEQINGRFNAFVNNKLGFAHTLTVLGLRVPALLAYLHRGVVSPLDGQSAPRPVAEWLADARATPASVVLKPALGGAGVGIVFLERLATGLTLNGIPAPPDDAVRLCAALDSYLVVERIHQADYAAAVYPHTTNTVRVLTLWDPAAGAPFVAAAAHRFGASGSFPVDNWQGGRGGLSAAIEVDTGVLGAGAMSRGAAGIAWHERHPETGGPIAGVRVPHWEATVASLLGAARRLPMAPSIGWDLVVTDGGPCVLEGNSPPATYVWQVHRPLLADPRARRFYRHAGVVS